MAGLPALAQWPALAAVLLVLGMLACSRAQDIHLHAARQPILSRPEPVSLILAPGGDMFAMVRESNVAFWFGMLVDAGFYMREHRWGLYLLDHGLGLTSGDPNNPGTAAIMVPRGFSPYHGNLLEHTLDGVGFFGDPPPYAFRLPGVRLLAGSSSLLSANFLGLRQDPGPGQVVYLGALDILMVEDIEHNMPPVVGNALAIAASRGAFFLIDDMHLQHVSFIGQGPATVKHIASPGRALQLEVAVFPEALAECPSVDEAVLVLLDTGRVWVCTCFGSPEQRIIPGGDLPAGVPVAGARLITLPTGSPTGIRPPVYLSAAGASDARNRLWQVTLVHGAVQWRRVVLPPAVAHVSGMQLALSRTAYGRAHWVLADAEMRVLFDADAFHCATDSSIVCDREGLSTGSPLGWTCVAGHVEAPLVSETVLCAGCAEGHYLHRPDGEAPFAQPEHECRPCAQAGCRTCDQDHCLVCAEGMLLEPSGPAGRTVCVASCSAGFRPVSGMCLPSGGTLPGIGLTVPVAASLLAGLGPGDRVTAIGPTWLSVDAASGVAILPASASGPATGVLLFTEHLKSYILPAEAVGAPGAHAAAEVRLLSEDLASPVVGFVDAGSSRRDGQLFHGLVMVGRDGQAQLARLTCPGSGACHAGELDSPKFLLDNCSNRVRRLGHLAIALDRPREGVLVVYLSGLLDRWSVHAFSAAELVVLDMYDRVRRAESHTGTWMLLPTEAGNASLSPDSAFGAYPAGLPPLAGRFLADSLAPGRGFVPVMLARGPGARVSGELLFTGTVGTAWHVVHVPGDMAVALPAGGPRYPSALLLLSRTFVGLSVLHCPGGPAGACALLPAVFADLPAELRPPAGTALWTPAAVDFAPAGGVSARSPGSGWQIDFLTIAPATGPVAFSLVLSCPAGSYGPMCDGCHPTCAACASPEEPEHCTACAPGRAWLHGRTCVSECPAGMWPDGPACRACPGECATCTSAAACTGCVAGRFLSGTHACEPCDGSCARCTDDRSCDACRPGLVFAGVDPGVPSRCTLACPPGEFAGPARCTSCGPSCDLCAGGAASCTVCAEGFRWASQPGPGGAGPCVPCDPGCVSCTADRCLVCGQGLLLGPDGACVGSCPDGWWPNGESCQPCDVSCGTCSGGDAAQCTGCGTGLDLVAAGPGAVGACVSGCPEGEYRDLGSMACRACDAACATCNGPTDRDCWRCREALLQDGDCVQACAARHVALAGRCLPCHVSCDACAGTRSTECLECADDLLGLPAGQAPARCVPACPAGYSPSAGGCAACPAHCASCPGLSTVCGLCQRGWLLARPDCVQSCPEGTSSLGSECFSCHEGCGSCFGPGPDQCLSCPGQGLVLVAGRCLADCPAGMFPDRGTCTPCSDTCAACTGPTDSECTRCTGDRALLRGTCRAGCPGRFFPADNVCLPCGARCASCQDASGCTGCEEGLMLRPDGGCAAGCPARSAECPARARCVPCSGECAACEAFGPGCEASCTRCEPGHVLSGGACHVACPAGEFLPAGGHACEPCSAACRTCFGAAGQCTGCNGGLLHPGEGMCASACAGASAPVAGVCLSCLAGCEHCEAGPGQPECTVQAAGQLVCPEVASCSRCAPGRLLLPGRTACVEVCPAGHFADADGQPAVCAPCHASCTDSCTGPEEGDCVSSSRPKSSRVGLAVGLSVGLLLLLILLVLLVLFLVRRRRGQATAKAPADDEDATELNTIVELALPGAILVDVAVDFRPLDETLGAGTQASVYAAQAVGAGIVARLGCPEVVAVKKMRIEAMQPVHHALFQNEVALMWLLREHGHIVRLFGYSARPPAIVLERFDGDLDTLLHSEVPLSDLQLADICQQWAAGLEAMHAHGVAHCDLKPGNVFVSRTAASWRAALGDLGTSKNLSADRSSALLSAFPELNAMSVPYAGPEVLQAFRRSAPLDRGHFFPADVYSASVMLYECLTRAAPWPGMDAGQITAAVLGGSRPRVAGLPGAGPLAAARDLIEAGWQAEPGRRPPAATVRQRCAALFVSASGLALS
ncbi:TKL protein kinase [Fonticula alba]|uniref:TKL protein kinase n=1 Tax=Fonticula alba TaxID=691883 RepID=A0A058Z224_FONAL|nr:TKL protein kinase [Fonticula alba]KCV67557.1 TKL protein kinase [Fonticula alba]|eukprot:XP_009498118.1 TKL protein kinase [Fonticula alba]